MRKEKMRKKVVCVLLFLCVVGIVLFALNRQKPADGDYIEYHFHNDQLLSQHYEKHGKEMGFKSKEEYEKAASDAANNKNALHKKEKEDNDDIYYVEATNEFVVISTDGYIRTYFFPPSGPRFFNKS